MARLLCFALIIAVSSLMCVLAQELYSAQYDYVDFGTIYNDKNLRDAFHECFMERTTCQSDEQKFYAGIFSEAYQTHCKKCTEKQKESIKTVVDWYAKNDPDEWILIAAMIEEEMKAHLS